MTQILAIVWVPSWFHTYSIVFPRRAQYVECTQYMATRTAILNVRIVLNQCLEEIAKKEAPFSTAMKAEPGRPMTPRQRRRGRCGAHRVAQVCRHRIEPDPAEKWPSARAP